MEFYFSTGGPGWQNNAKWLVSDPCLSAWYGVSCCPLTHPALTGPVDEIGKQACCRRSDEGTALCSEQTPVIDSRELGSKYCAVADEGQFGAASLPSLCVVVGLNLANNSLSGELVPHISLSLLHAGRTSLASDSGRELSERGFAELTLHHLQVLHVENNHLSGRLPLWLQQLEYLRSLRLESNLFEYEQPAQGLTSADGLYVLCGSGSNCTGVPPHSCGAFFPPAAVRQNQRHGCIPCNLRPDVPPILWWAQTSSLVASIAVLCALVIIANGYAVWKQSQPRHLRRWVAAVSILITHAQMLALVGDLHFAWPDEIRSMSALLSADVTWLLVPECSAEPGASQAHRRALRFVQVFNAFAISGILMATLFVRKSLSWIYGSQRHAPVGQALDIVRTTFHVVTFNISIRAITRLFTSELFIDPEVEAQSTLAVQWLAGGLLFIANVTSWRTDVRRVRARAAVLGGRAERSYWSAYLCMRFAVSPLKPHAAVWQHVIFVQQLSLAVLSAFVNVVGLHMIPILGHGVAALLSLLIGWMAHNQMQPYEYTFMNVATSVFYLGYLLLVSIGLLHEYLMRGNLDVDQLHWLWLLERTMFPLAMLFTTIGAGYLVWGLLTSAQPLKLHRRRRERRKEGTFVPIASEISPAHGPAVTYVHLPSNALAVESILDAQKEMDSLKSGGIQYPDACVLYARLRPQGSDAERALFIQTFDAFRDECCMTGGTETLELIARTRAAVRSPVWYCQFARAEHMERVASSEETEAECWRARWSGMLDEEWRSWWTQTNEWDALLTCAMNQQLVRWAAFLITRATPEQPSYLHAIFVFHSAQDGAWICREVFDGGWSPVHTSRKALWSQVQHWDLVCDAGKVSKPHVDCSADIESTATSPLDLEKLSGLKKYMYALRALPASGPQRAKLIALRAQLEQMFKDHNIPTQHTQGGPGNAMEQIGRWLQTSERDEAGYHGADVAGSLTKLLEQEIQGAMLAATANTYPRLSIGVQTAWPNELCAWEPTETSLEGRMDRILQCVIKYNGRGFLAEDAPKQPSFNELGFSVHLCRHMASKRSDARLLEKWWLTIVDRRVKHPARTLVLNEWLGNKLLHAGRMQSALDPALSSTQDILQEFEVLAEKGLAVLYDDIFSSAFIFPHDASGGLTVAALVLTWSSGKIGDTTVDYDLRFCCTDDLAALTQLHLHAEDMRVLKSHLHRARRASKTVKVKVAAVDPSIGGAVQEHFERLVGNGSGLPLSKLGDAMLQLERKLDGAQLRTLIRRGVKDARAGRVLNFTEFKSLLLLDIELRREALFLRLVARCPEGVRAVLTVPPLYTSANDSEATARQEWYALLCYDLVWSCVYLKHGELQLGEWREMRALAARASLSAPVRVHVCANDAISHRSEAGSPIRKCCCWLTFENAARPMVVPGEIYNSHDECAPSELGVPTPAVEQHNLDGGGADLSSHEATVVSSAMPQASSSASSRAMLKEAARVPHGVTKGSPTSDTEHMPGGAPAVPRGARTSPTDRASRKQRISRIPAAVPDAVRLPPPSQRSMEYAPRGV